MKRTLGAAFLVLDGILSTSLTLPLEMMHAAESAALAKDRRAMRLNIASVGSTLDPIKTQSGFKLSPDCCINEVGNTQMLIIPSLWRNPRLAIKKNPHIIEWLKTLNEQGTIIIGVGTGCCFMAEAGLLDDKPATTHWHFFDQFAALYPKVNLKRQYFITQSHNLYCAASINAVADLTVHFIHRAYGADVAHHVQRHFSHEIRKDYASTSYYDDKHRYHPDEDIVQAQIWLQNNCQKEIKLQDVSRKFDMSIRNFNRRFKQATDQTPLQYLQEIRIDMAKDLLQTSNLSISEIADRIGYKDMGYFAALFKKHMSTTPSQYRSTVRAKLFKPNN
jgi:transcriptional regulator GlxA family with amidase domain